MNATVIFGLLIGLMLTGMPISIALAGWGRAHGMDWLFTSGRAAFAFLKDFNFTWAQE